MSSSEQTIRKRTISMREIGEKVQSIVQKYRPAKVILFGSSARGDASQDSDVDLLVIIDTEKSTWDLAVDISSSLRHSFPMDIVVRTPRDIEKRLKAGDFFVKDIIENGKILYERTG